MILYLCDRCKDKLNPEEKHTLFVRTANKLIDGFDLCNKCKIEFLDIVKKFSTGGN